MTFCKNLTIFEGCDNSGKTTAAKEYAAATNARYVHFGPMNSVTNLARFYIEAMMPALLGYQDVVFDRSWLSEEPYGRVFRGGKNRIGVEVQKQLERIAARCGAVVIYCEPPLATVIESFNSRRSAEMLDNQDQLVAIYSSYFISQSVTLPIVYYNWQDGDLVIKHGPVHKIGENTIGPLDANTVIVCESQSKAWPLDNDASMWFPLLNYDTGDASQIEHALCDVDNKVLWVAIDSPSVLSFCDYGKRVYTTTDKINEDLIEKLTSHIRPSWKSLQAEAEESLK